MAAGARDVFGDSAQIVEIPMADGGEGTLDVIAAAWGVTPETMDTVDAIGRPCRARFGISADGRRAVIEAAEANGLPNVCDVPLQPLRADTFGVGLIARAVLDRGVQEILLCVGGSATTDGGTGLLRALGARFLAGDGTEVPVGGGGLAHIVAIDAAGMHERARSARWLVAVDVDNPLTGERGAAATYGPQKGATPSDIQILDAGLSQLARVAERETGVRDLTGPGTGAAGGISVSLVALLGATLQSGSALVADAVGLTAALAGASFILTGEGSFDDQSLHGKVVAAVVAAVVAGAPQGCPVVVVAGKVGLSAAQTRAAGIAAAFSLADGPATLAWLQANAAARVREVSAQACGLIAARATAEVQK
jgi:glycerate kinase